MSIFVVVEFSVPDMANITESDSSLTVCITMTTNPPWGIIAKEVTLLLSTEDGTGILLSLYFCMYLNYFMHAATVGDEDFSQFSMPVKFIRGSGSGALMCRSIIVLDDDAIEGEENFTVTLTLLTSGASLRTGNDALSVTLTDIDGEFAGNKSQYFEPFHIRSCFFCFAYKCDCC
jgi:hypothetical protein